MSMLPPIPKIPPRALERLERLRHLMAMANREAEHYRQRREFMENEVRRFLTDLDMSSRQYGPLEVDDEGRVVRAVPDAKGHKERIASLDHIGTQIHEAKKKVVEYRARQYRAAEQAGPLRHSITEAELSLRELGWRPDAYRY